MTYLPRIDPDRTEPVGVERVVDVLLLILFVLVFAALVLAIHEEGAAPAGCGADPDAVGCREVEHSPE